MSVIRYLMATLAVIAGASVWSVLAGHSLWEAVGMVFLAVVFLQLLILVRVVLAVRRRPARPADQPHEPREQREAHRRAFILPD